MTPFQNQQSDSVFSPESGFESPSSASTPSSGLDLDLFSRLEDALGRTDGKPMRGQITQVIGMLVKAILPGAQIGEICELRRPGVPKPVMAEVLGFSENSAILMPLGGFEGLSLATEVIPMGRVHTLGVGNGLLGRVLDGLGNPIDASEDHFVPEAWYPVNASPPDPLSRQLITRPLALGIRAIDGLLTCGEGQRMGIFAAAGAGKSTLLAQALRNTEADVVVLALVGERGREVREFLDMVLTPESRKRAVVIVSTSDRPALEWLKSAFVATTIAEYFRDQGLKVLMMLDSVTRLARAQRLLGLATGEPPARRGFPPSVFAMLPRLLERAGPAPIGSITALYTVLVEGDDMNEPIADEVRSILDGHIVLSRKLAAASHYPAISILDSISRVMNQIVSDEHREASARFRELLAAEEASQLLRKIGEYKEGSDPLTDEAISKIDRLNQFLRQDVSENSPFAETLNRLTRLAG